jgi:hypothetical protein
LKDGYYGIITKKSQGDDNGKQPKDESKSQVPLASAKESNFDDHYSVGVLVKITD